jgi:plastocyanin
VAEHKEWPMIDEWNLFSRRTFAAAAVLLAVSATSLSAAEKSGTYTVTITQMRYGTLPDNLKAGDTIVWVNKDTVQHTVTAKDHSFDIRIPPGKQASQTLAKAGTFPFYCVYHTTMRGTLKVAG